MNSMTFDKVGPLGLWNRFDEQWIGTRRAAQLFLIATLFVLALLPVFLGMIEPGRLSRLANVCWGIVFLWLGMWRYWARLDNSGRWAKRFWFVVMLAGFWYGSCLYCWFIYLPQVIRAGRLGVQPTISEPPRHRKAVFGGFLLTGWVAFLLFVVIIFAFPKLATVGGVGILRIASIVLVLASFGYAIGWLYRQGVSRR
jgi:hypothetical protein